MPKLPAFEDWRRPWKDGELDEERAAKLVYDLKNDVEKFKDKASAETASLTVVQAELDEAKADLVARGDQVDRSDVEKDLQRQVRELTQAATKTDPKAQGQIDRLTIALEKGLSLADAKRLIGENREELEADAAVFAKDHGIELSEDEGALEDILGPPSRGVRSASEFRTGASTGGRESFVETDPAKVVLPASYR